MKSLIPLLLLLIGAPTSAAEAFKCKGSKGETIFSDTPCGDGKEIELREVPTMEMIQPEPLPPMVQKKSLVEKYDLRFLSPEPNAVLRGNEGIINVAVKISPALGPDSLVQLRVNGELHGKPSRELSWTLHAIERGIHTLTVEVISNKGVVISNANTSFTLHKTSANHPTSQIVSPSPNTIAGTLRPMPGQPGYVDPARAPGHEWHTPKKKSDAPLPQGHGK